MSSGRLRFAHELVAPWKKGEMLKLHARAEQASDTIALLQPAVIASVRSCDGIWCRIRSDGFDGFIEQGDLWGVYPQEKVE